VAEVTKHDDLAEFWTRTKDFFNADPVFHTVPIAAVDRWLNHPDPEDEPPLLVTADRVPSGGGLGRVRVHSCR
jgi:hypothetical protein